MSNNIYLHEELYRGKEAMAKLAKVKLTVCGAGAIGSNLIDGLARQGFADFTVIDCDRIKKHNINNQAFDLNDVGNFKIAAMEDRVYNINSGFVIGIHKRLEADNVKKYLCGKELVVDCFDNIPSRRLVADYCRANKIPCLHLGILTDLGEAVWNDGYSLPPDDLKLPDACEYPLARNICMMTVVLGCEVILRYILEGKKKSAIVTLKDFAVRWI